MSVTTPHIPDRDDADLWFSPDTPADSAWDMPGPRAPVSRTHALLDWRRAEAVAARHLAETASSLARLDERLRTAPGLVPRLALEQAARLSWLDGPGLSPDRLALHDVLRVSMVADGNRDLAAARWAFRRLGGGPGPLTGGEDPAGGLSAFLGRHVQTRHAEALGALSERPEGSAFVALADKWSAALDSGLHPLTRAAQARVLWDQLGLSGGNSLEGAVVAARLGAEGCRLLPALPYGPTLGPVFTEPPDPRDRLALWYDTVTAGANAALAQIDRITDWQDRAAKAIRRARLKGRTPPLIADALASTPALSVAMAVEITRASPAAALRNLDWFAGQGLTREITGQGRFRFWALT